ncbi:hypothetical protein CC1G_07013 [Coprinopsis cinerea okayama7|uniref:Uncharacterized protein n=1 Tax=Coprinopsis cinerea (strain Okayama-7 / 130 / ATCC MYA-4618 / FGSC 9003) TaxID=240176 RepID=A8NAW0_COPC7|nr:hypothetical protein CC1G_07013 [Coprinopsis cinerea okayama7\|eukprot:XP_001831962.1 hypothetical protein CC1G_07013 [Coprinopsis cinerea okayama7\
MVKIAETMLEKGSSLFFAEGAVIDVILEETEYPRDDNDARGSPGHYASAEPADPPYGITSKLNVKPSSAADSALSRRTRVAAQALKLHGVRVYAFDIRVYMPIGDQTTYKGGRCLE